LEPVARLAGALGDDPLQDRDLVAGFEGLAHEVGRQLGARLVVRADEGDALVLALRVDEDDLDALVDRLLDHRLEGGRVGRSQGDPRITLGDRVLDLGDL